MKKHPDCEDRCQRNEHKGYPPCDLTSGECEWDRTPAAQSAPQGAGNPRNNAEIIQGYSDDYRGIDWLNYGGYGWYGGRTANAGSAYSNPNNFYGPQDAAKERK